MAFTKAQLEALKNSLLASNQPILASQHRQQIQSIIDEMYDAQSRANILVGVQSDSVQGGSDTFLVFRSGQAYQLPVSLLNANDLASLGDVFINNLEDGDSLVYDAVANRWENRSVLLGFELSNLTDVQLNSLAGGDILRYNATSSRWENVSLASLLAPYALLTDLTAYQKTDDKGQPNGYASLDGGAKVPSNQLPSFVDDVLEFSSLSAFPTTGETGKIYVALDTNKTYRWSGSAYIEISPSDVNSVFGRTGVVTAQSSDYASFYATLDTAQTITGAKTFSNLVRIDGQTSDAFACLAFKQASGGLVGINGYTSIHPQGSNLLAFRYSQSSGLRKEFRFNVENLTDNVNRVYLMPNSDGTIALTSDLHAPVTIGTANGLSLAGQAISLGLASASTNGALSSTDWTAFNNKLSGSIGAGQVGFGNSAGAIVGDSGLVWDNTNKSLELSSASFQLNRFRAGGDQANIFRFFSINDVNPRHELAFGNGGVGDYFNSFRITVNFAERWRITGTGVLQSNGAQTIRTSTGALRLETGGGNGNILLTPNGSGNVGIGTDNPGAFLDVRGVNTIVGSDGLLRLGATSNGADVGAQLTFGNNTARRASIAGRQEGLTGSAGYLQFGTRDTSGDITEGMRLTSDRNLLLNTTTALAGGGRLQVNGNINIATVANATGDFLTHTNGLVNKRTAAQVRADIGAIAGTIGNTHVAFGNSAGAIVSSSDFTYNDSTKSLGIGVSQPRGSLDVFSNETLRKQVVFPYQMVIGKGDGGYGTIAYNADYRDATSNIAGVKYLTGDTISQLEFVAGGFIFRSAPSGTTGNVATLTERFRLTETGNIGLGTSNFGFGSRVIGIANATTVPSANPSGGGVLYVEGGALKYRGSSGTITTIANA
jgi:hypothetical protein